MMREKIRTDMIVKRHQYEIKSLQNSAGAGGLIKLAEKQLHELVNHAILLDNELAAAQKKINGLQESIVFGIEAINRIHDILNSDLPDAGDVHFIINKALLNMGNALAPEI